MKLTIILLALLAVCQGQLDPGVNPDIPNANVDGGVTDDFPSEPTTKPTPAPPVTTTENTTEPATISTVPTEPTNTLGKEESNPGKSCDDIYQNNAATRGNSGSYWIHSPEVNRAIEVVCNMELQCDGTTGGWLQIVNFDAADDNSACPGTWGQVGGIGCTSNNAGCSQVFFRTHKLAYHKVCGFVTGYQKGATDGFQPAYNNPSINAAYVDGVSITVQPFPIRKHIWTYAAGLMDHGTTNQGHYWNCPCATFSGIQPPSFVFDHYYCESGAGNSFDHSTYYTSDPLWDGDGCSSNNNCCTRPGMPWFYRSFPAPLVDDIETRICRDQHTSNENILVAKIALYVK